MRYNVVLDRLQNLINYKPSQAELCQIMDVKQSTMSNRASRNSDFTSDEIVKLNNYYHINLFTNEPVNDCDVKIAENNIIKIPYWDMLPERLKIPDFSCVMAERNVIKYHWYLDPESLCIVPMVGDKMTNYWYPIKNGDILIIDTLQNYIIGNGVYFATSRNNSRFWIREMQALINDDIQIKGFAPSGETIKVFTQEQLREVDFQVIGKVIKNVSFRL